MKLPFCTRFGSAANDGVAPIAATPTIQSAPSGFTSRSRRRTVRGVNQLPKMRKSGKIALSTGIYGMGMRPTKRSSSRTIKHLTKEQLRAFFRAIPRENIRDRLLFNVMYLHALRRGEAAILMLDSFEGGMIHVKRLKGGRSLSYDMFPSTIKLLRRYLAIRRDDGCVYLFRGLRRACVPLSGRTIDGLFRRYATAAGLPPGLRHSHVLRHSLGTHLANEGVDIADAAEQLGHSDLNSTAIYFEITNRRRAKIHRRMLRSTEIVRT
ncbi:MAG: tyrosine-type recombinase/integrase [Thermoanaerobaculia bacterium]